TNGYQLQRALTDAIDPGAPRTDYYRHHPWRDDNGYLQALVGTCQTGCSVLPAYADVRAIAIQAATPAGVQALNHEPDPSQREAKLKQWVAREPPNDQVSWFELTAAASAWLTVLALLALAAKPGCDKHHSETVSAAYFWISLTAAMLDSYADAS